MKEKNYALFWRLWGGREEYDRLRIRRGEILVADAAGDVPLTTMIGIDYIIPTLNTLSSARTKCAEL